MPRPLSVDPVAKQKASTAVLVRMSDRQKAALHAYAEEQGLNYGAACRQLLAQVLTGTEGATT